MLVCNLITLMPFNSDLLSSVKHTQKKHIFKNVDSQTVLVPIDCIVYLQSMGTVVVYFLSVQ